MEKIGIPFVAIFSSPDDARAEALKLCEKEFGQILHISKPFNFSEMTDYYSGVMGSPISKAFYAFRHSIQVHRLFRMKEKAVEMEAAIKGMKSWPVTRPVNIDPGCVTAGKVLLTTNKDHSHRVPVSENVLVEVTMFYKEKEYQFNPWTYSDYKSPDGVAFFKNVRQFLARYGDSIPKLEL